ncbi:hypothetical protein J2S19_004803 [Metabacillus malikii]|uniref:Uncharacterized protein n=1 Tax=Metabacillus malikii TaxID=1504265 RepID=A0ABT9ZMD4_9BACI|nr:hypothetical protein [Metabacillus malikii]
MKLIQVTKNNNIPLGMTFENAIVLGGTGIVE